MGTFESANGDAVLARSGEVLEVMDRLQGRGYTSVMFAVIDILRECTTILVSGHTLAAAETFGGSMEDTHTIKLHGILSRKKDIVPLLPALAKRIGDAPQRG